MTHDRDIERLLDAWLADGPGQVADRVIDGAAARIARQHQRPAWRLRPWRFPTMSTPIKLMAIGAALLVVLLGGVAFLGGGSALPAPAPTPTPTPTPTPVPSPPALPTGLLEARDYVARALPGDSTSFIVAAPAGWSGLGGWALSSPAGSGAPSGIGIAFLHGPQVVDDPCSPGGQAPSPAPSPPSVDGLVAALSARRDLQVSGVTDTVLAGFAGKRVDLQLPASVACAQHYVFAEPQGLYAQGPANRWRVWMLDAGGDPAVVVLMDFAGTTAADRADAQGAIDSVRITP